MSGEELAGPIDAVPTSAERDRQPLDVRLVVADHVTVIAAARRKDGDHRCAARARDHSAAISSADGWTYAAVVSAWA